MRHATRCCLILGAAGLISWQAAFCAAAERARPKFTAPFAVRDGVVRDAEGREVRLWGVNYYVPFCHNYLNIAEVGADHRAAIDEDLRQFQIMGVDFVRIHIYDREISDAQGHLTPNHHLEVFDYLLEKLDKAGIFLMLTPVVWWNTPENQALMDRYYAYWHVGVGGSFGFSNFYGKDEMLWNEDALRCQQRYMGELLSRQSAISGRRYAEFPNLVAIEPINEPQYISLKMLEKPVAGQAPSQWTGSYSHGPARDRLRQLWSEYQAAHPGDEAAVFAQFRARILRQYLQRMYAAIDAAMGRPYLKAHIDYAIAEAPIHAAVEAAKVDVYTTGCYPKSARGFDSSWNDHLDFLELIRDWDRKVADQRRTDRPRIIYEHDAPSTLQGYPFGAMALAFAARHVQMAAMFTYTPTAVAAYNPGWRVHYLNLLHTSARAVAFAAAGDIFRRTPLGTALPDDPKRWQGEGWLVDPKPDLVAAASDGRLLHSAKITAKLLPAGAPNEILACGSSPWVTAAGNGAYHLLRASEGQWDLEVFPNQVMVNDPFRGRAFRSMANRYINVNEWPVVSRLQEESRRFLFQLPGQGRWTCTQRTIDGPEQVPAASDGSFSLKPGRYTLTRTP